MKLRILHTEWSCGWGGQEIRIVAESKAFQERGYSMVIACQPDSQIIWHASQAGIPVIAFPMKKGLRVSTVVRAYRLLRNNAFDLVHTHSSVDGWNFGLAARLAGVPVVRSRHLSTPIRKSWSSRFVYMKLADRVITSGAAIREAMIRDHGMRPECIVSVPAGVDISIFQPGVDGLAVRQEFGLSVDDYVIGIVAVLRNWKGHHILIRALAELIRRGRDLKLLIVGEGPQEKNLRRLIGALGLESRVVMAGYRHDVPSCMAAMDCVVLPSLENEATSQVLPQAMAMKKPVIASNVGGLMEVVIDGQTGLLVPPGNVSALADAIARLHDRPAEAAILAERGYEHCRARFTFEGMIAATEQVYQDVLRASKGSSYS